jgi:acyl dehydratase
VATETLDGLPATAPMLARAALTARGRHGDAVPDRTLRVEGVRVDRHRLAAYQRLTGYDVSDTLPQPYPWVLAFPVQTALMVRPDFPLPLLGAVHIESRVTSHRALDAGDVLALEASAGALRPHRRGRTVEVRLTASVDGVPVWDCENVYLAPGRGDEDAPRAESPPALPEGPPMARWRLPEDLGRRYAGVSGDVNPIHLHPLSARVFGMRRHIVHGMWSYARTLAALGRASLGRSTSRVWFTGKVYLPTTVELVLDRSDAGLTAGLRSARDPEKRLLVLTLDR